MNERETFDSGGNPKVSVNEKPLPASLLPGDITYTTRERDLQIAELFDMTFPRKIAV